ncbi:DUF4831 family protein [Marinilabiliaceae bacterium ANBcel2]|nr:DUF4831 family protein [Marinilabiliaceae bacterium ANBcel2]
MRNVLYTITALFLLSFFAGCSSNEIVQQGATTNVEGSKADSHGLYYYLPKTVIDVQVIAEKRVEKAGPFYRFAGRFLNLSDLITEDVEEWRIVGANISVSSVPDPDRLFRVTTQGVPAMAALELTDEGILKSINIRDNLKSDAISVNGGERDYDTDLKSFGDLSDVISLNDLTFDDTPYTGEQLVRSSTTAMAEEASREIGYLRENRTRLIDGDFEILPPDGAAYEILLNEIDKKENAYLDLFRGKSTRERYVKSYQFIPSADKSLNATLLRFSHRNGFLDRDDVSGTPVYINIKTDKDGGVNLIDEEVVERREDPKRGVAYCMPAVAEVSIVDRTLTLVTREVYLGQFGHILRLPEDLFDGDNSGALFNPTTGALKQVVRW